MNQFLILFYIYIFLEGILRKWVMPGVPGSLLYGIKYVLLVAIAIFYIARKQTGMKAIVTPASRAYIWYALIVVLSGIAITGVYNGLIPGVITIIQYVSPLILISTVPQWINTPKKLNRFLICGAIIAAGCLILAIVQYASPPNAIINKYAMEMKNGIAKVGDAARICSVFSYITPFGDFCLVTVAFSALLLSLKSKKVMRVLLMALLVLGILGCVMTGSRSVVLLGSLYIVGIGIYQGLYKGNWSLLLAFTVIAIGAVIYYNVKGIVAVDNFLLRVDQASGDVDTRLRRTFDISRMFAYSGAFGNGAGIANTSVQSMLLHHSEVDWEEEIGRVMIEFGFIGFIAITFIRVYVWMYMLRLWKSMHHRYYSTLSLATVIVITPMTFYIQMCLYNWFAYMVYFTMIGLNIAISRLDREKSNGKVNQEQTLSFR